MTRNSSIRLAAPAAVLACSLALAPVVFAQGDQTVERGFAPEKVYDFSSIDQVNLFNGNLSLTIPIGPRFPVGGGFAYGLTLVYNSNVWKIDSRTQTDHPGPDHTYVTAEPQPSDNVALGWRLTLGELYPAGTDGFDRIRYLGEDGSEHLFYKELHSGEAQVTGYLYTRDGSYLRLHDHGATAEVEMPDGTVKRFVKMDPPPGSDEPPSYRLERIFDRFGNTVTVSYDVNGDGHTVWTISDSHRTQEVEFVKLGPTDELEVVRWVRLASFGVDPHQPTATWTFTQDFRWIARSCLDDDPMNDVGDTNDPHHLDVQVPLLTEVLQPDGSTWRMPSYNTTCADDDGDGLAEQNLPGTIETLVLPTDGEMAWTYQTYGYPSRFEGVPGQDPPVDVPQVVGVAAKEVHRPGGGCWEEGEVGCRWTYTWQSHTGLQEPWYRTTTVHYPSNDETVFYFSQDIRHKQTGDPDGNGSSDLLYHRGWHYGLPFRPPAEWGTQPGGDRHLPPRPDGRRGFDPGPGPLRRFRPAVEGLPEDPGRLDAGGDRLQRHGLEGQGLRAGRGRTGRRAAGGA